MHKHHTALVFLFSVMFMEAMQRAKGVLTVTKTKARRNFVILL